MTDTASRRVRLIFTADGTTRLVAGSEGTVIHVDDRGTLHVLWDDGSTLGLLPHYDVWAELCARCGEVLVPGCCPTVDADGDPR